MDTLILILNYLSHAYPTDGALAKHLLWLSQQCTGDLRNT